MNYLKALCFTSLRATSLLAISCLSASATSISLGGSNLDSVIVEQENLFPEGVEYSSKVGSFFLSSQTEGTVYQVNSEGISPFVEDERLVSSLGLQVDEQRNRLLVANSDLGFSVNSTEATQQNLAALGIYDLFTGESIAYANLGTLLPDAPHVANDIAVDALGNAYVTDSFSPVIYQVDPQGNPSIFLEDERFAGEGFNLNGIVYHPNEFLIATKSNEGLLFKVPLDNPEEFSQVQIDRTLLGSDGLFLVDNDSLVVVSNELNQVFALDTNDNWESAMVVDSFATPDVFPTTATVRESEIFTLYSNLGRLFDPNNTASVEEYTIQQVGSVTRDATSVPEPISIWGLFVLAMGLGWKYQRQ